MKMTQSEEMVAIKRPYSRPVCRSSSSVAGTVLLACSNPLLPFECVNNPGCCLPEGSNETDCDINC
jgi:hypothetical protein